VTTIESPELPPRRYTPPSRRDLLQILNKERQRERNGQPSWYRDGWVLGQALHLDAAGNIARYAPCIEDVGLVEQGALYVGTAPVQFVLPACFRAAMSMLPTAFMLHRLAHVADQPNIFCPSEGLAQMLSSTELRGVLGSDVRWPYHTFAVELPPDFLSTERDGLFHPARSVLVAHCDSTASAFKHARRGPYMLMLIETEFKGTSASGQSTLMLCVRVPLPADDAPLSAKGLIESMDFDRHGPRALLQGREVEWKRAIVQVAQLILNLGLYLGSAQAEVRHLHAEQIARLTQGKSKKEVRKTVRERIERLQRERVFPVGSSVRIDPELREQLARTDATGGPLTYRTIVRGHWKRQVSGEGRSERKTIWIRPYVRGSEDLPQALIGHTYKVA